MVNFSMLVSIYLALLLVMFTALISLFNIQHTPLKAPWAFYDDANIWITNNDLKIGEILKWKYLSNTYN